MAKIIALTDIHGRLQVFECPPWRVVKLTSSPDGTSVDLSNGNGIATVKVSDTQQNIGLQLTDGTSPSPTDQA
jgi:hypothetical protein